MLLIYTVNSKLQYLCSLHYLVCPEGIQAYTPGTTQKWQRRSLSHNGLVRALVTDP